MVRNISPAHGDVRAARQRHIVSHAYQQRIRAVRAVLQRVNWTTIVLAMVFVATLLAVYATEPH